LASRRDQLQSYQFLVHRVISALVMRETDPAESPLRRGVGAVFAGIMITVIVAAGFSVVGLITHIGNRKWQFDGAVVVEKETGAVFLYENNSLHPMANYASALLASGHTPPTTASVSRNSLVNIPRGGMLGIPNAPSALPDEGKAVHGAWSACALPTVDAGQQTATTLLMVSGSPGGAQRLADDHALVVQQAGTDNYFLVYHGYRYALHQRRTVLDSLYGTNAQSATVSPAWLNTLVEGKPIDIIRVPDAGAASAAVPGHDNGDLLLAQLPSGPEYFVVFPDGLAAITTLQKDIYVGQTAKQPISISVRESTNAKQTKRLAPPPGDAAPPTSPPPLLHPASSQDPICAVTGDPRRGAPTVWVGGTVPGPDVGTQTARATANGAFLANRVVVPPGQVAVVRILASPSATAGTYNLVTDVGVRYPVVSEIALAMLGYPPSKAVDVPAEFANLLPAGPTLDPAAARQSVDVTARPAGS
jgi:ESX secretion system ATPase EccB